MRLFLLPVLLIGLCFISRAQQGGNDSITYLEEVIVSELLSKAEATGITPSVVIGEAVFRNYSPIDLPASMNQLSGVYVLSGAMNTNRITIRGVGARTPFGTDKIRLYLNDIPVTDGTGFSTIEAFDPENLGTLELIKGPKGTAFGSNLGGAVILNTKADGISELSNSFTLGSYGLLKNNLGISLNEKKLEVDVHYGDMSLEGYRENSAFDRKAILLTATYNFNSKNRLEVLLNHIDYSAQISSSLSKSDFEEDPRQAAFIWKASKGYEDNRYTLGGLNYRFAAGEGLNISTSLFYSYLDHYEPRPFNILDEFTNTYGLRSRASGTFHIGKYPLQYSLGTEIFRDEYNWGTFENLYEENNGNGSLQGDALSRNKEFRRQFNLFGSLGLTITDSLKAQFGLNMNRTRYDFRDQFNSGTNNRSANREFSPIWLPGLDLEYRLAKGNLLYANISRGFSNPSLEETLTPEGLINPEIRQETGTSYELGTRLGFFVPGLYLETAVYRMHIKNLLVAERVGEDQFIGRNAGRTLHQGLELELSHSAMLGARLRSDPFLSYTYNDHSFVRFIDAENDYAGNPLTGVPGHRLTAGWRLEHTNGLYGNVIFQQVGEIPLTDSASEYSDAYSLLNCKLGFRGKLWKVFFMNVSLGINNLTDRNYAQSVLVNALGFDGAEPRYFYPGNGLNFYSSLQLSYRL